MKGYDNLDMINNSTTKNLEHQNELLNLYLKNMWIIKRRIRAVLSIYCKTEDRHTTTLFPQTNIEFSLLQIRKILELIALSSLVSNIDLYKAQLKNVERMWNARLIFRDIEKLNSNFYPEAIVICPKDKNTWYKRKDDILSKEEFVKIYEKIGKAMHEDSPFLTLKDAQPYYKEMERNILIWIKKIQNLLWTHIIKLEDKETLFYVSIAGKLSDLPHGNIFKSIDSTEDKTSSCRPANL